MPLEKETKIKDTAPTEPDPSSEPLKIGKLAIDSKHISKTIEAIFTEDLEWAVMMEFNELSESAPYKQPPDSKNSMYQMRTSIEIMRESHNGADIAKPENLDK